MALVLELAAGRRDVRVPDLGELAARELDVALVERRIDLQEEHGLFDVQHLRHDPHTVPSAAGHSGVAGAATPTTSPRRQL